MTCLALENHKKIIVFRCQFLLILRGPMCTKPLFLHIETHFFTFRKSHNFELLFDRHILYEDVYITRFQYEVSLPSPLPVSKIGLTTAILQNRRVCKLGLTTPILQNRTSLQTRDRVYKIDEFAKSV